MDDRDIERFARRMATALPERPPVAPRRRERFVVERAWREGDRYLGVEVRVDQPDFLDAYSIPGQYVTFEYADAEPRFLVIASGPDTEHFEFLIDLKSDFGEAVADLKAGQHVILSPPEGRGYPARDVDGRSVLMFATGAGVASMRPVLEYFGARSESAPARLALYYGERRPGDFAYVGDFGRWRAQGVRIYQAVEDADDPTEGYRYVQHAFEDDDPGLEDARIFVSGAQIMMEHIIARLLRLGVPRDHIHINV